MRSARITLLVFLLAACGKIHAQDASASLTADANKIFVGDQARVFLSVTHNPATSKIQWPIIPDSLQGLEIEERDRIDTIKTGAMVVYRQRLNVTGFDSGIFTIPRFTVTVTPNNGAPYSITTDSLQLLVQTVPVDTTKAFKPIKGIIEVKSSWLDYIWLILGLLLFAGLAVFVILYFIKNKKVAAPPANTGPVETLQEKALRMLAALEGESLWQKGAVKEYYVRLTDIVRGYVEARFGTPALELTTDELLSNARHSPAAMPVVPYLEKILYTADLAKFARAQPTPAEHADAMQAARDLVQATPPPPPTVTPTTQPAS